MNTNNLRKLALETNDGFMRGPALVAASEIDRLRSENERLTKELEEMTAIKDIHQRKRHEHFERAEKAEAERDKARAQVAAAYEAAKQAKVFMAEEGGFLTRVPLLPETKAAISALTPADAQAALEAYGREKVEQALDAANAYMTIQYGIAALGHPVDRQRILAEMEKLK